MSDTFWCALILNYGIFGRASTAMDFLRQLEHVTLWLGPLNMYQTESMTVKNCTLCECGAEK